MLVNSWQFYYTIFLLSILTMFYYNKNNHKHICHSLNILHYNIWIWYVWMWVWISNGVGMRSRFCKKKRVLARKKRFSLLGDKKKGCFIQFIFYVWKNVVNFWEMLMDQILENQICIMLCRLNIRFASMRFFLKLMINSKI